MSGPTIIPTITAEQFAARLFAQFPRGWASPDAGQTGNVHALLKGVGTALTSVLAQVQYAKNATLIPTETSPELDLASEDFFGDALPRPPGMSDAAFSALILSSLFSSAASRPALSLALTRLTGQQPRMIDPWNPGDTGAWDAGQIINVDPAILTDTTGLPILADGGGAILVDPAVAELAPCSYWDVDSRSFPFRWTGEEQFTGFIESAAPPQGSVINGNPVLGWDDSWYWDIAGSSYFDIIVNSVSNVFALVNRLRAYGCTIGVKIVANPQ